MAGPGDIVVTAGLRDKVFVVTGAASGIGRSVTSRFASEGAYVLAVDIDRSLEGHRWPQPKRVRIQLADIGEPANCERLSDVALDAWGRLDGVVNCAAIAPRGPMTEVGPSMWDSTLAINLRGAFFLSKYAVIAMKERGTSGSLLHIASVAGLVGMPNLSAYSASKGGLIALVRALSIELAPLGIRANCICPGATDTPAFHRRSDLQRGESSVASVLDSFPLLKFRGRLIAPEEIAEAAVFLSSDSASMITGLALQVDGGYVAQ